MITDGADQFNNLPRRMKNYLLLISMHFLPVILQRHFLLLLFLQLNIQTLELFQLFRILWPHLWEFQELSNISTGRPTFLQEVYSVISAQNKFATERKKIKNILLQLIQLLLLYIKVNIILHIFSTIQERYVLHLLQ